MEYRGLWAKEMQAHWNPGIDLPLHFSGMIKPPPKRGSSPRTAWLHPAEDSIADAGSIPASAWSRAAEAVTNLSYSDKPYRKGRTTAVLCVKMRRSKSCHIRRSCADKHGVSKGARTHNNLPTVLQSCSPDSGRDYWGIVKR